MTSTNGSTTDIPAANKNLRRDYCAELSQLQDRNAHRWNPSQFRYMEALAERVLDLKEKAAAPLNTKLADLIDNYSQNFEQAQADAQTQLTAMTEQFPESADEVQVLFEQGQFIRLSQRQKHLTHKELQLKRLISLSKLTSALNQHEAESQPQEPTFELRLQQQEQEALGSIFGELEKPKAPEDNKQLRSMKYYQRAKKSNSIENLADAAIKSRPENPGPLNPQMLAIRALTNMKKLSPGYLSRFIAQTETLLWLEKAGENIAKKK